MDEESYISANRNLWISNQWWLLKKGKRLGLLTIRKLKGRWIRFVCYKIYKLQYDNDVYILWDHGPQLSKGGISICQKYKL